MSAETRLRYVVLRHEGIANPHFDLMWESQSGSSLKTVRFASWPPMDVTSFERLPDHRAEYLEYEGAISKDRGFVRRIVSGFCRFESGRLELDNGLVIPVGA